MGILRRFLSISVGVAAGTFAYKLLKDYNEKNLPKEDYVSVPVDPAENTEIDYQPAESETAPQKAAEKPDNGPNVNPVTLGAAEKPVMENGKLDPTKIASPEDFLDWDEMGCQS